MSRRGLIACLVVVAGCGAGDPPGRRISVVVDRLRFSPDTVEVTVGDTVVWENRDLVPHTVTGLDPAWSSGPLGSGGALRLVPAAPGIVRYQCDYHPTMRGVLRIR